MAGVEQRIFLKKISANGGVDFALKRCYSRGTSESNTDFLDFICLSQLKLASFSDQSAMTGLVSEGKKRPQ